MKYLLIILFFVTLYQSNLIAQPQSDNSDSIWAIVMPISKSQDIDMKKELIGRNKDSVIFNFISNIGSYDLRIDSIFFTGIDAKAFNIISSFPPYLLSVSANKPIEIRFKPVRLGIHKALINIITQSDTLVFNIIGEGIEPKLLVLNNMIDFGNVPVGDFKDTINCLTIKNISSSPITITESKHSGPNDIDFSTISGTGNFVLQPGEIRKMDLKFKPTSIGRTSGTLNFSYNDIGSPATVQLFGNGVGLKVYIENDSAFPGDFRFLKLKLEKKTEQLFSDNINGFHAIISYNSTILRSQNNQLSKKIESNTEYIEINSNYNQDDKNLTLDEIEVIAGLGNSEVTDLNIVDFHWTDIKKEKLDIPVEKQSGKFYLLGVCEEGGKRLLNPNHEIKMMNISPNPNDGIFKIELTLIENGLTSLSIVNNDGQVVYLNNFNATLGNYDFNINSSEFANGVYYINLQTPTFKQVKKLLKTK